jgi:hypothetical protein
MLDKTSKDKSPVELHKEWQTESNIKLAIMRQLQTTSEPNSSKYTEQPMKFRDKKPFLEMPFQYKVLRNLDIEERRELHIQQQKTIEEFNIIEQKIKKTYRNYYDLSVTNSWHTGDSKNTEMFLQSQDDYEEYMAEIAGKHREWKHQMGYSESEQQTSSSEEQENITIEQIQQKRLALAPNKRLYNTQSQVTTDNSSQ